MAKKRGGINRTEKVHEYLLAHPDQSITEVLAGLAEQRIKVSRSLVSQGRTKLGLTQPAGTKKKTKKKAAKKKAAGATVASTTAKATSTNRVITVEDLYEAKKLAEELGGIDRVREALAALEGLR